LDFAGDVVMRTATILNFIWDNLRNKMVLGVSLILFSIMGSFTYYELTKKVKSDTGVQENKALEVSNIIMRSVEYPMLDGEMEYVQRILEDVSKIEDLAIVTLCDLNGTIRYGGQADLIGCSVDSEVTKKALKTKSLVKGFEYYGKEKIISHAMPIRNEKACYKCHGSEESLLGVLSVGINWSPIEKRIIELRNHDVVVTLSAIGIVGFFLTLWLARYITRPISALTRLADGIVLNGKCTLKLGSVFKCWEELDCDKKDCPAYGVPDIACWFVSGTLCYGEPSGKFPNKIKECRKCEVYRKHSGDEIVRLTDSLKHMLYRVDQSEANLRSSEKKYRDLFNANPNAIFIVDKRTFAIIDLNERAQHFYGYSREDLLQQSFFDLSARVDEDILIGFTSIKGDQHLFYSKRQYRKKDGTLFYVNIRVCPADYNERSALIVTTTDVTETVEKEAQLIQASKMSTLGTMASGVAHELNQPLNVIRVGSDFFMKMIDRGGEIDLPTFRTMAEEISKHVDRASAIINHLRAFARPSDVSRAEININGPIQDVFKVLGQQLTLHQIHLDLDLADDLPPILADHNRLEQVFVNLITNACDALEERGIDWEKVLRIKTFVEGKRVVAIVSDNGIGIPKGIIEKVFEPFFTTKEVGKGTGLGVSISYGIVKDYGGEIVVESGEGEGTSFKLSFPIVSKE
jgi:PAS domain S-box-containing protein